MISLTLIGSCLLSCQKKPTSMDATTSPNPNDDLFEQRILSFIETMDNYKNTASKWDSEKNFMAADSARFLMETSLLYAHARIWDDAYESEVYSFEVKVPLFNAGIRESDVGKMYNKIKDSLRNYLDNMPYRFDAKKFEDVLITMYKSADSAYFQVNALFGFMTNTPPAIYQVGDVSFEIYYPDIVKYHWDEPLYYNQSNQLINPGVKAIKLYSDLFYKTQKTYAKLVLGGTNYLFIKDPTPYGVNMNFPDIIYGPPSSHYYPSFPHPGIPGLLETAYFMAGSDDYNADDNKKTYITREMLDFYLHKCIHLASQTSPPGSNWIPWMTTFQTYAGNVTKAALYYTTPTYPHYYLDYNHWRRWEIGVFYAQRTMITLPPLIEL